ncbi:hypothetical protein U9M48_007368, partial [Paspalum notatum var. saurae]
AAHGSAVRTAPRPSAVCAARTRLRMAAAPATPDAHAASGANAPAVRAAFTVHARIWAPAPPSPPRPAADDQRPDLWRSGCLAEEQMSTPPRPQSSRRSNRARHRGAAPLSPAALHRPCTVPTSP